MLIRTERLTMRPWSEQDVDELHRLWTDPRVRRYLWDDVVLTREQALAIVHAHVKSIADHGLGYWALHLGDDQSIIGFCGFRTLEDTSEFEIVYGLLPDYWGRGLAVEAARAVLDYYWRETNYTRVFAQADVPNMKSFEVMRRLGMRPYSSTEKLITYVLDRPEPRH